MKKIFDSSALEISKLVTEKYSTSFSLACKLLSPEIRASVYAVYGFVRYADEIVDSFGGYPQEELLNEFEEEFYTSLKRTISLNPIINSFQQVVRRYKIELDLVDSFFASMRMDLNKKEYSSFEDYKRYIYGSADVVGLMCLKIFVNGDNNRYNELKPFAMHLGSAFQKVNFLRDLKDDKERLERSYFPHVNLDNMTPEGKVMIISEIEIDFELAYKGILKLPIEAKLGVYTAYRYYKKLLRKLKKTEVSEIRKKRMRVSNPVKLLILGQSYLRYQLNLL